MTGFPLSKNKLHGKVAIVTGGASGIGEATAHCFISHGARAVVIGDIQDEKGRNVTASIGPDRSTYIHCDVADENQVKSLVESTVSMYGRLDVMFSNARIGSSYGQTVMDMDMSAFDKVLAVNTRGMAACVKHAARAMKEGGVRGSIICTASVLATRGFYVSTKAGPDTLEALGPALVSTDYVMSKHAVIGLVRSSSLQLAGDGIRVNSVSPGMVGTPLTVTSWGVEEEEVEKLVESWSRLKGVLKEKHVADAVSFLASDESDFVTGLDLAVDGGFISKRP